MYELRLGETKIYDGVIVSCTEDNITLTIKTNHPLETTLEAIRKGERAAQYKLDRQKEEKLKYANNIRAEFAKESVAPFFDTQTDIAFVKGYLKQKAVIYFEDDTILQEVSDPIPNYGSTTYADYGVTKDTRPIFEAHLEKTEENGKLFSDFYLSILPKIFVGPGPVSVPYGQQDTTTIDFEVNGQPSRLARDIIENDSELATTVAQNMGLVAKGKTLRL